MNYTPRPYQEHATTHIIDNKAAGLFLEMGLGKTVSTLTAINELLFDSCEVSKVLVIAPKNVADIVWTTESQKWDHLRHLRISKVLGTEAQRKAALKAKADIYIINRENVAWLVALYGTAFPFDCLVIDELSSFKDAKSARFKALRQVRPKIKRVIGLTGTPAPNGLLDLWPQLYLLDMGQRLGPTLTEFRGKFFSKDQYKPFAKYEVLKVKGDDLIGEDYYERKIYNMIEDICISMKAKDWLDLPPRVDQIVDVRLPKAVMDQYLQFEKEQVLALMDDAEITAVNAGALTNKLLQFANGAVYNADKEFHEVHMAKIEALEEDLEAANGNPFLLFYQFKHDVVRIQKHLKRFKPRLLTGAKDVVEWNQKKIPFLLAHAASAGHGLNMQDGGNLMGWFGPTWSLELYQQACARLDRQGQTMSVINRRYIVRGTMDEDAVRSLDSKERGQNALMDAVKAMIRKYKGSVAA